MEMEISWRFEVTPLTETKVEVTAFNVVEQLFQLFICLDALYTAHTFFFWRGGEGGRGCGLGGNAKIAKLTIFAIHPFQCFDAMVKEIQLNKTAVDRG